MINTRLSKDTSDVQKRLLLSDKMVLPVPADLRSTSRAHDYYKITCKKLKTFCTKCAIITFIILLLLSLLAIAFRPIRNVVYIGYIETEGAASFKTDARYLSIALDSSVIADGFKGFNMTNPKLIKMMKHLSPGYLRIGGTMADRLLFTPESTFFFKTISALDQDGDTCAYDNVDCDSLLRPNFTMSGEEWLQLNKLASAANFIILFDLNCLIRNKNGSWNSENAELLIRFSNEHNLNVIWELGNEPNAFRHVFNYGVNATQLAMDFIKLRKILNKYPKYRYSFLVGPDTTRPQPDRKESIKYLEEFLFNADHAINAVTWHQYYFNGRTASSLDFVDPDIFDLLSSQINIINKIVRSSGLTNIPIWLGETSSAYGGGAPGYSDRFVGTFIWLDKLGMAAENGIDLVIRQSIFKGYYALINDSYEPSPDWWVSVLYKTFVGPEVVPCYKLSSKKVRLYCQCTNKNVQISAIPGVTVFGVNLKETNAKIRIEGLVPISKEDSYSQNILAYILTSKLTLLSRNVVLNGETLSLQSDGSLPPFKPKIVPARPYLIMPPFSLAFWIIPSPNVLSCQKELE